jgi:beta-galactosidase
MLYVGTNYHPHDWDEARWGTDIKMMKEASFNIVRLGHLCWDSFEPRDGVFCFEWFDRVMDRFSAAGIQVVLDIATRPAPVWLHKKHPSINITDLYGKMQHAHSRYMEDVGNPLFQEYAYRFAKALVQRYAAHPALLAFGMCNELGAGFVSYSEEVRQRFTKWLKNKYGSIEALNRAWSTQRWSRRLGGFEDVELPASSIAGAPPERYLDMCRFYSDEIIEYMAGLKRIINQYAPGKRESTNHWAEHKGIGFDYLKAYKAGIDIPGTGFYPGINPEDEDALIGTCMILDHRIAESGSPIWCLEFQTGTFGGYACPKKAMRMYAYLALLYRSQAFAAWTWRSMLGGEEQYWFGLLDHDGEPGRKYFEFKQIAEEFQKIGDIGLPRASEPEIAIAYSFESLKVSLHNKSFYKTDYYDQLLNIYKPLFRMNMDCNIVDLRQMAESYKALFIPGHCVMDERSAETIRNFVSNGGTAIMTAYSAKVNEHNQVFDTAMPGLLSDVFGIRANAFERTRTHVGDVNEGGMEKHDTGVIREKPGICLDGHVYTTDIDYYEIIELKTAHALATFTDIEGELPAISIHRFGKGTAIYTAFPAQEDIMRTLIGMLCVNYGIKKGLDTPIGVAARQIDNKRTIYVNTTASKREIARAGRAKSLLTGQEYFDRIDLEPYGADIVE